MDYSPRLLCQGDFLGKNIGMDCHFLLQGIFLTVSCIAEFFIAEPLGKPSHTLRIHSFNTHTELSHSVPDYFLERGMLRNKEVQFFNNIILFHYFEIFGNS